MKNPLPTTAELAASEAFQHWVLRPTPVAEAHFRALLDEHPEWLATVAEARELVRLTALHEARLADARLEETWDRLRLAMDEPTPLLSSEAAPLRSVWRRSGWWLAASVVLALSVGVLAWRWANAPREIRTGLGQTQNLTLPDGSVVTLNANSSLRYAADFADAPVREVWLSGEGFFSVRHLRDHRPFRVRTSRLTVRVLGTEFNLTDRPAATRVVLQSGKIEVNPATNPDDSVLMKPGDLVEVTAKIPRLTRRAVPQPHTYRSWTAGVWTLQNETLDDVARRIEDEFGVAVHFAADPLRRLNVSGIVSARSLDDLLPVLEATVGVRAERREGGIVISEIP